MRRLETPSRLLQQSYVDAIVINYMRNRIVDELKVEKLTTRGGHHRKQRRLSRPDATSVASQSDSETDEEEDRRQ